MTICINLCPWRRSRKGFSLAEVAIAVAIAALGITTLIGVLPAGLDNLRQAGESVAVSRICQQMINEVQSADWGTSEASPIGWSRLRLYDKQLRYFDTEGTPITNPSDYDMNLAFVAQFEFPVVVVDFPGAAAINSMRPDVKRLVVHVAVTTRPNFDFQNSSSTHERRAYNVTRQF
ncbi:MAG: Verru_Chthon cassette protein B [Proteobacteria bacterium]|nr:Verru_Chthon cassette protein B [Pseudomonadota bacterium]